MLFDNWEYAEKNYFLTYFKLVKADESDKNVTNCIKKWIYYSKTNDGL